MDISGMNYIKYKWSKERVSGIEYTRLYYLCEKVDYIGEPEL